MTPDQHKDEARLEHYIMREGLSSVMNDTKWREAMDVLQSVFGSTVWFRVKDVRGAEPPSSGWWDRDFEFHRPRSFKWVEWMEIDPVFSWQRGYPGEDYTEAVAGELRAEGIPFHMVGTVVRIQGYTRPKQSDA